VYSDKDRIFEMPVSANCLTKRTQPLGISYHPVQDANWNCVYDAETALMRGTISHDLDLPYVGRRTAK